MSKKSINLRVDEELKSKAEIILSEMGLNMSSTLNKFLQQMVNEKAFPFVVEAADPFFSKSNQNLIESRLSNYDNDRKVVK